jgi:2,4-dienoyl-CoA reductase (NADPH2)
MLSPIRVGQHVLPNRVVMGSMHTRLEYGENSVARQAAFFGERARGGTALIITGGIAPNWEGRIEQEAHTLERADQLAEHRPIVEAVHAHGGRILLQILHTGAYAKHADIVGMSAVQSPINSRVPRMLTAAEIEQTIDDFVRCSELAIEAGYDGVEFMGSEGYFLNQCVARRMNTREDEWGGTAQKRMRLPVEVVRRTRARLGPLPIVSYRMSGTDLVEGGQTAEEIDALARALETAGIDMLNVGVGWHEAVVPTIAYMAPRGAFVFAASRLKSVVRVPVVGSNRINMPEVAETLIARGDVDLVSLARPLLADPHFVNKSAAGRAQDINTCIACNQACLDYIFLDRTASCLVNPRACRETEFDDAKPAVPRRIAVVGAGPAGLSVAVAAAERGHAVTLYEASAEVGGQINLALRIPGKREFAEMLRYYRNQLVRTGVDLRLDTPVTAPMLAALRYDAVVVATGILPRKPAIAGIDHPGVVSYLDVITGRVQCGPRVAIIGTGGIGYDVAVFLTAPSGVPDTVEAYLDTWGVDPAIATPGGIKPAAVHPAGREVTLFQRGKGRPGERLGKSTGWIHRIELRRRGVQAIAGCTYQRIDDAGLHYTVDGHELLKAVDHVVICAGQEPNAALATALAGAGCEVHVIGGAREAGELDAVRATDEGLRLAYSL